MCLVSSLSTGSAGRRGLYWRNCVRALPFIGHSMLSLGLDWLHIAELDVLDEIRLFAIWAQRLGSGERDLGEASVLAAAERRHGTSLRRVI